MNERKAFAKAVQVAPATRRSRYENTGTFGAFRSPAVVGVSDDVRIANRRLVRSARRAERAWLKTLPKGVTV